MAITRDRASNSTANTVADATWTDILPALGTAGFSGLEGLVVQCLPASAAPLKVAVQKRAAPGDTIHNIGIASANTPDNWIELAAGESYEFIGTVDNKITRAMVSGSGGTASVKWTGTAS